MSHGDWRPSASLENLQTRAAILEGMRTFFRHRGVLEVDTPALSMAGVTDPNIESFGCDAPGAVVGRRYLHTSPEFPMKRLLCAGLGDIYQIAKVFRQGESGRRHNPEFTLLEWYRVGFSLFQLMAEVAELVEGALATSRTLAASEYLSYGEVFDRYLALDPHRATSTQLQRIAEVQGVAPVGGEMTRDGWLDLLMATRIEPQLGQDRLTFVYDYPASQAALARVRPGEPAVAERFELYLNGVELANGFHELADASEQRHRFEVENQRRTVAGQRSVPCDERLLAALEAGLPDCSGVAVGVDRLMMVVVAASSIDEVIAFPFERA